MSSTLVDKKIRRNEQIIAKMDDGPEKVKLEKDLEEYKTHISKAGTAWDDASHIGYEKVEIGGRMFPYFSCVMGKCDNFPKWDNIIQKMERECDIPIGYCIYGAYHTCTKHAEKYLRLD